MNRQRKSKCSSPVWHMETDPRSKRIRFQQLPLSTAIKSLLLEVIKQESPENPWRDPDERVRNELLILLISQLALRTSELVSLKLADFDFDQKAVMVGLMGRPRSEPTANARGRRLPLTDQLAQLASDYISNARQAIRGAGEHDFVFVTTRGGSPLSSRALSQIFATLRKRFPETLLGLTPNALRQRWCQDYLQQSAERNSDFAFVRHVISQRMGVSPRTVDTYLDALDRSAGAISEYMRNVKIKSLK